MHRVILLLGSNLGDREENLASAKEMILLLAGKINKSSSVYETEPWGFEAKIWFLNQVIDVETELGPDEILKTTMEIEAKMGRTKHTANYSSRIIDIDILFYDDILLNTPKLKIPHPRIAQRRFVLEPLSEMEGEFIHPGFNKKISELLSECPDNSEVRLYKKITNSDN